MPYMTKFVVEAARELIKNSPDAIYKPVDNKVGPLCLYTQGLAGNGACGCVVGQAIIKAYPELEGKLKRIDKRADEYEDSIIPGVLCLLSELEFEGRLIEKSWLDSLQAHQDKLDTWGNAAKKADEHTQLVYGEKP